MLPKNTCIRKARILNSSRSRNERPLGKHVFLRGTPSLLKTTGVFDHMSHHNPQLLFGSSSTATPTMLSGPREDVIVVQGFCDQRDRRPRAGDIEAELDFNQRPEDTELAIPALPVTLPAGYDRQDDLLTRRREHMGNTLRNLVEFGVGPVFRQQTLTCTKEVADLQHLQIICDKFRLCSTLRALCGEFVAALNVNALLTDIQEMPLYFAGRGVREYFAAVGVCRPQEPCCAVDALDQYLYLELEHHYNSIDRKSVV